MKNYYEEVKKRLILSLTLIFGLLFSIATAVVWKLDMPLGVGIGVAIVIVLLQYLLGPWIIEKLYKISYEKEKYFVSEEVLDFINETCRGNNIKCPKIGIIEDGNPNAFTFGYTHRNARLILTTGLIDILEENEQKAVIAHEIGHIKHYDFIAMMIISVIPLIMYQIYSWTKGRDKTKPSYWIGIGAYLAYILSQYCVLMFSRIREYYADNFAKNILNDGEPLKSALIKIAYGFTSIEKKETSKISAMAFTNNIQNEAFMLTNYKREFASTVEEKLMRWDLKNVWGKWYEFNSTHPLTSKRILALNNDSESIKYTKTSLKDIGSFIFEVFINILPYIVLVVFAINIGMKKIIELGICISTFKGVKAYPWILSILGVSILVRYYYSYGKGYKKYSIDQLLAREDASPVKGIPAVIKGKIIGKGIPGFFCSEDIALDDGTGIILTDYRQPLKIFEFLFGILKTEELIDKEAEVVGWYKRGMRPYFVSRYFVVDGKKYRSYNYILTQLLGYTLVISGMVIALFVL